MNTLRDFPLWNTAPIIITGFVDREWGPRLLGDGFGVYTLSFLPPELLYAIPEEERETFDLIFRTVMDRLMYGHNQGDPNGPTTRERVAQSLESMLGRLYTRLILSQNEQRINDIIRESCYGEWPPIVKGAFGIEPFIFKTPNVILDDVYQVLMRANLGRYRYMDSRLSK